MLDGVQIETSASIAQAVIWLHGLGADGDDFAPIVDELQLESTRFIFPHAPYRPVTLNNGYEMRAWFDIYGLGGDDVQDVACMQAMQTQIEALIQTQLQAGIPSERIVLAGFSQGGAMAAYCALAYPMRLGGLMMLSSYLPQKHVLPNQVSSANQDMPIFISHGLYDDVIKMSIYHEYCALLRQAGFHLETHEYAMGHSVCDTEIVHIRTFLERIFCG